MKPAAKSRVSLGAVNPNTAPHGVRPTPSKFVTQAHVTSVSPSPAKQIAVTPQKLEPTQLSEIQKCLASVAAAVEKLSTEKSAAKEEASKPPLVYEQDSPLNQSMAQPLPHHLNQSMAHDPLNTSCMHPGMVSSLPALPLGALHHLRVALACDPP